MTNTMARAGDAQTGEIARMNMIQAVNSALDVIMDRDPDVVVMGEDVGYFGGVFRATAGLQAKYGKQRVFDTPITECGIIGVAVGIPAGVFAAVHRGRWPDHLVRVLGLVGYSVPVFWLGLVGLLLFYAKLDWAPGPGRLDVFYDGLVEPVTGILTVDALLAGETEIFWNALSHLVLPASILGYFSIAYISRMTRSFMLEQLSAEYITTARVKGLSERAVIWRHAFRNIAIPLVTVIALSFGSLLEGSVLTEIIFSWPGIGKWMIDSISRRDYPVVQSGLLLIAAIVMIVNLIVDLLYPVLDVRLRDAGNATGTATTAKEAAR